MFPDEERADSFQDILDFDEALRQYQVEYPIKAQLVELRCFTGLSTKEAAETMRITPRTAERYWQFSRAWLCRYLNRK